MKPYTEKKFEKIFPWFEAINLDLLKAPVAVRLLVTDKCACKCHMCTHWKMKKFYSLDYKTFSSIVLACQNNGTQSMFLSGGDVFSWECWERFLKDEEITIAALTVTPLIIPKSFDKDLLKRLKWLRVSFDAIKSETFKKIRGVNALSSVKHDLSYILANKLVEDIGMTTVLQKDNFSEIIEMGEYFVNLGIKRWIVQPVNYNPRLSLTPEAIQMLGYQLSKKFGEAIPTNNFDVLQSDFSLWNSTHNLPCIIPRMEAFIDTRLRVWPCCNLAQDAHGDEERAERLKMGTFIQGASAGEYFLELWRERRNLLDKFTDFKDIHPLCKQTCKFKYFYYNLGFDWCRKNREAIYI